MASKSEAGRIGIWGRSGSGKSSYVKQLVAGKGRVVVFDPMEEYEAEGFLRCKTIDDIRKAMIKNWSSFRLCYVPTAGSEPKSLSALSRLLMAAQAPFKETGKGAKVTLVVEEMNTSFSVSSGVSLAKGFAEICSRGRHYGIEIIGISQRIAEVSTRFRGNCTQTVAFCQKGDRDIAAAANELGCEKTLIKSLEPLTYVIENNGVITHGKIIHKKK